MRRWSAWEIQAEKRFVSTLLCTHLEWRVNVADKCCHYFTKLLIVVKIFSKRPEF